MNARRALAALAALAALTVLAASAAHAARHPAAVAVDARGRPWVALLDSPTVLAYDPARPAAPAVTAGIDANGRLKGPVDLRFDARGRAWIAYNNSRVARFTTAALERGGHPAPDTIIQTNRGGALNIPAALTTTATGDVVVAFTNSRIARYAATAAANAAPAAVIQPDASHALNLPEALAVDASGTLWTTSFNDAAVADAILTYAGAQLERGGFVPARTRVKARRDTELRQPQALAFDARGHLWVLNYALGRSTLARYPRSSLGSGDARADIVITGDGHGALDHAVDMSFDAAGHLWVANYGDTDGDNATLTRYDAAQLAASGAPAPAVTIPLATP